MAGRFDAHCLGAPEHRVDESTYVAFPAKTRGLPGLVPPILGSVARLLDRLKTTIAELGYEAVIEDLSSPDLIGDENSLLASDDVMVVPGQLADSSRQILLGATKGCNGKEPQSFGKAMRQVKARLDRITRNDSGGDSLLRLLGLGVVRGGTSRRAGGPRQERSSFLVRARRCSR